MPTSDSQFREEPELSNRDFFDALGLGFDLESQLSAIRGLLSRNRGAAAELASDIQVLADRANHSDGAGGLLAVDDWSDRVNYSAYQSAAHSMAAIGMLAPLFETVLCQTFNRIGARFFPPASTVGDHARWRISQQQRWNCRFVLESSGAKRDIVKGVAQLCDALGVSLPPEFGKVFSAIVAYRNFMFHNGLEWPGDERERFREQINQKGWSSDWFPTATIDDQPWIYYLSDTFVDHCFVVLEQTLAAIGRWVRTRVEAAQLANGQQV